MTNWKDVLLHPLNYEWSTQGLGMLRTYLSRSHRLHVWHSALKTLGVSTMHDHPWDFSSQVLIGRIRQYRFSVSNVCATEWNMQTILCGEGGHGTGEASTILLRRNRMEVYWAGETYEQQANEIHESWPDDGTVTIIDRTYLEDDDHARVFWPIGQEWVSAEPRPASQAEVLYVTGEALRVLRTKEDNKT